MPRCLAAALFAAIVLVAATPSASAASFDCGRAFTALEKTVCQDPRLGDLDARMARNYITLLNRISDSSAIAIRADQKTWLKRRDACGDDKRCINREYVARIKRIGQLSATVDRALEKAGVPASIGREPMIVRSTGGPIRTTTQLAASPETIRTTAQQAASPAAADTIDVSQPKSPGIFRRMLSKVAPKLAGGNSQPSASDDLTTPPALRPDQEPRRQSTQPEITVRQETDLFREATLQRDDAAPVRRKVVTKTHKPAGIEAPDPAPIALAAPEKKKSKRAKDTDVGEPAVLLYTTPDVSSVIRMPDGESPFDQLDAQGAFDEPPGPPLKVTPRSLAQPAKRAFDARRFDAFDAPNG